MGLPLEQSTPAKIKKVSSDTFDHFDVWKAINSSESIKMNKFDCLKDDARVWIGKLECGIVAVGGLLDIHGLGVLSMYLDKEASKWFVKS